MKYIERYLRGPSKEERVANELRDAEISRLEAIRQREYYTAMEDMLNKRIARLKKEK